MTSHPQTSNGAVDFAAFDHNTGGDAGLQLDLARLFCATTPAYFAELTATTNTPDAWTQVAHTLKGSALSVGATSLAALCDRAQTDENAASRSQALGEIGDALEAVLATLSARFEVPLQGARPAPLASEVRHAVG